MTSTSSTALFQAAADSLRQSLSEDERELLGRCLKPEDVFAEGIGYTQDFRKDNRKLRCLAAIKAFSDAFAPYFEIVNIFVQIKPEWLGCFWGPLRLIMKLGSNCVSFLEEVCAKFEEMAGVLPQYAAYFDTCMQRSPSKDKERLVKFMSFLYVDVLEFYQQVYLMLSRAQKGKSLPTRVRSWGSLMWKPFHHQFRELLERMQKHKAWFECEMSVQDHLVMTQHYQEFQDYLKSVTKRSEAQVERDEKKQQMFADMQIDRVKAWISSPPHQDVYDKVNRRTDSTACSWFFENPKYQRWRNAPFEVGQPVNDHRGQKHWLDRTIGFQAKPGFGKTYLSVKIINDLRSIKDSSAGDQPTTVFFHFEYCKLASRNSSIEALRAVAEQLVHAHRENKVAIDSLILLRNGNNSGQSHASFSDIAATLNVLLIQHPTFLVFDGLDECSDPLLFLNDLKNITMNLDCRILLSSRSNIRLTVRGLDETIPAIYLGANHNHVEIKSFLHDALDEMILRGLLDDYDLTDTVLEDVTKRANGMFLWARLLIETLSADALTPHYRLEIISKIDLLEGLENLYSRILNILKLGPTENIQVAAQVFRWLSASYHPMSTKMLHAALAIIPKQPTSRDQYLCDFPQCLPRITCALIDADDPHQISFIHRSVDEYLRSASSIEHHELSLCDQNAVHAFIAAASLSYLVHDVPKGPLNLLAAGRPVSSGPLTFSNRIQDTMTLSQMRESLGRQYPMFRYSVLCWTQHLNASQTSQMSLTTLSMSRRPSSPESLVPYYSELLSQFLIDRIAVTTWVEGSWLYGFPPSVSRLTKSLSRLHDMGSTATVKDRELRWIILGLKQLSQALDELKGKHRQAVSEHPKRIWGRDIVAATDAQFWPVVDSSGVAIRGIGMGSGGGRTGLRAGAEDSVSQLPQDSNMSGMSSSSSLFSSSGTLW